MLAHRLSHEIFVGPIPAGKMVCHRCDNRKCINPEHFYLGTAKINIMDSITKDRSIGRIPEWATKITRQRKLTDDQVRDIRSSAAKARWLAEQHGVSVTNIYLIRSGQRKKLVQ